MTSKEVVATIGIMTIGIIMTLGSGTSIAVSQGISPKLKSCTAMTDDKQRLRCFDRLFGTSAKPEKSQEVQQTNWSLEETKSVDGSAQVIAANLVNDTVLIVRCKDQITEAAFSTQYNYLGSKTVDVEFRINDENPVKELWTASVNGHAAFAPNPVAFIQSLPDNAKLSIKTTRSTDRKVKEGHFNLGAVSEVRNKIAVACDWSGASVDEPVGSINRQEKR